MDADQIRQNIIAFMHERSLSVADWSRRAGIDPAPLYAYVQGRTSSLAISRLIALADAENVPFDVMIGRHIPSSLDILSIVTPLIISNGDALDLPDVAEQASIPLGALRDEYPTIEDLVIAVYLAHAGSIMRAEAHIIIGSRFRERISGWFSPIAEFAVEHSSFFLAAHSHILKANAVKRRMYADKRTGVLKAFVERVISPAEDIIPVTEAEARSLANSMLTLAISVLCRSCRENSAQEISQAFSREIKILTSGLIVR